MRRALSTLTILSILTGLIPISAFSVGASLYLNPASASYSLGNTFSVDINVNTGGQPINAAEGSLLFDTNAFEVIEFSKSGSVFTLWTQDPSFSNSAGTISFGGGVPTPGFTGASGRIFSIKLKVKATGTGTINWSSGSVLANDGLGTNILASMVGGTYRLNPSIATPPLPPDQTTPPPAAPSTVRGVPAAPIIISTTHPEENQWYAKNLARFEWNLPDDITGVSIRLDDKPASNPGTISDGILEFYEQADLADGVHYVHIRFRNRIGWSEITHKKIMVDTEVPEKFDISIDNGGDSTNPAPALFFKANDKLSGISHYEVKIDGQDRVTASRDEVENVGGWKTQILYIGKHTVIAEAFDMAGNSTMSTNDFIIEPIDPPFITDYPTELQIGEILAINGTFRSDGTVKVFSQKEEEEIKFANVKANENGEWTYVHPHSLSKGVYRLWAEGIDKRGAQSLASDKINIAVKLPILFRIGRLALDYLTVMVSLIAIIVLIILLILFALYRVSEWRKRMRREVREAEESVQKAFDALYADLREQLEALESVRSKRELTKEEKRMTREFKQALDVAEQYISKEISDVEKELE